MAYQYTDMYYKPSVWIWAVVGVAVGLVVIATVVGVVLASTRKLRQQRNQPKGDPEPKVQDSDNISFGSIRDDMSEGFDDNDIMKMKNFHIPRPNVV